MKYNLISGMATAIFLLFSGLFMLESDIELIIKIGWIFLFGGEIYLGLHIIEYYLGKSEKNNLKEIIK